MSIGYDYRPGAVSPASQGGYGYSYGFSTATPMPTAGANMSPTTVATLNATIPPMGMPMGMGGMPSMMQLPPNVPSGAIVTPQGTTVVAPVAEESYVENILRLNRGKVGTFYMTYENNREWNAKVFKGVIEAAGRDHIIISDPTTGMRYLLLMLNLDYVTFDGPINYEYPINGGKVTNMTPVTTS